MSVMLTARVAAAHSESTDKILQRMTKVAVHNNGSVVENLRVLDEVRGQRAGREAS